MSSGDMCRNVHSRLYEWRTKRVGLLENSARGVWALTAKGNAAQKIDPAKVKREVQALDRVQAEEAQLADAAPSETRWEDEVLDTIKQIPPKAFETLCQRLLR